MASTKYDDLIILTSSNDEIYLLGGNDVVNGGEGADIVYISANIDLFERVTLAGVTKITGNYGSGDYSYDTVTLSNVEFVQFADQLVELTTSSDVVIEGTLYNDTLSGTDADDFFDSKGGDDVIDGGLGNDTLLIFEDAATFDISTLAGVTKITGNYGSGDYSYDTIISINNQSVLFDDGAVNLETSDTSRKIVIGTKEKDVLIGTDDDDIFEPWDGNDDINGLNGSDLILIHDYSENFKIKQVDPSTYTITGMYSAGEYAYNEITIKNVENIQFLDKTITVIKPNVVISDRYFDITEGSGITFTTTLQLSKQPTHTVSVTITENEDIITNSNEFIFDAENWSTPQKLQMSVIDDELVEGQEVKHINFFTQSIDPDFDELEVEALHINITDNDSSNNNSISGVIWNDVNHNQIIDSEEDFLSGLLVYLDTNNNNSLDFGEKSVLTNQDGKYTFSNVSTGTYVVRQVLPDGYSQTTPRNQFKSTDSTVTNNYDEKSLSLSQENTSKESADTEYHSAYRTQIGLTDEIASKYTGKNSTVVILDTGIDLDHSHFGLDLDSNGISDRILTSIDFSHSNASGNDGNGHGTHVSGIIASSDETFPGIVPDAKIISLKVLTDSGRGSFSAINEALEWCIENADKYNITSINMSLGDGSYSEEQVNSGYSSEQLAALNNLGVCVISASGNGYYNSEVGVSYPSSDVNSFSIGALFHSDVGSIYRANTSDIDRLAPFSQRDDELTTVFAPGVLIPAASNDGGVVQLSGTSMASPVVAGTVALLQSAAQDLLGAKLTSYEIEQLLIETGDLINDGDDEDDQVANTGLNFVRINISAAISELEKMSGPGGYSVTVLDNENIDDINFGIDRSENQGSILGESYVATAASDIIQTEASIKNYFGGLGNDTFIIENMIESSYGGEGDDTFILTQIEYLNGIEGNSGTDRLILKDISDKGAIENIGTSKSIEVLAIENSSVSLVDNYISRISIINSNSDISILSEKVDIEADESSFAISATNGQDTFSLESNFQYSASHYAWNVSSSWQTGTNERISLNGKYGYKGVIDGMDSADTLILSDRSEAFFLHDSLTDFNNSLILSTDFLGRQSTERFRNIEIIKAGSGDDIVDLTSPDYLVDTIDLTIFGDSGDDVIWGSNGTQRLYGNTGNDNLFGGEGNDHLYGGIGSDTFEFIADLTTGHDTIHDFSTLEGDSIKIYIQRESDSLTKENFIDNKLSFYESSVYFDTSQLLNFEDLNIQYQLV